MMREYSKGGFLDEVNIVLLYFTLYDLQVLIFADISLHLFLIGTSNIILYNVAAEYFSLYSDIGIEECNCMIIMWRIFLSVFWRIKIKWMRHVFNCLLIWY